MHEKKLVTKNHIEIRKQEKFRKNHQQGQTASQLHTTVDNFSLQRDWAAAKDKIHEDVNRINEKYHIKIMKCFAFEAQHHAK